MPLAQQSLSRLRLALAFRAASEGDSATARELRLRARGWESPRLHVIAGGLSSPAYGQTSGGRNV